MCASYKVFGRGGAGDEPLKACISSCNDKLYTGGVGRKVLYCSIIGSILLWRRAYYARLYMSKDRISNKDSQGIVG